jgi:hypothetical protein
MEELSVGYVERTSSSALDPSSLSHLSTNGFIFAGNAAKFRKYTFFSLIFHLGAENDISLRF